MNPAWVGLVMARMLAATFTLGDSMPRPSLPHPLEVARGVVGGGATVQSPQDVEYSEAYYRRLSIHRAASYAILPLFVLQYAAGSQLYDKSSDAPDWAKLGHRIGATGVAGLFGVNLLTGIPNLIEGRRDPRDRPRRVFHATMMLAASAGFTATGLLAERAESSPGDRRMHRAVALTSMGVATVGYLSMLDAFRRD